LTFQLPHACQSLALEVAAAAADGSVGVVTGDSDEGAATEGLLTSLEWQVLPLLDEIYDLRPDASRSSRRGYTLIDGGISVTRKTATSALNSSYSLFSPASSSIAVKISLALQPYFSKTTLTEKTSLLELFASIVGLAGIFSVFGILFQQTERMTSTSVVVKSTSSQESALESPIQQPMTNPLSRPSMHRPSSGIMNRRRTMNNHKKAEKNWKKGEEEVDDDTLVIENRNPIYNSSTKVENRNPIYNSSYNSSTKVEKRREFSPTTYEVAPTHVLTHSSLPKQQLEVSEDTVLSQDEQTLNDSNVTIHEPGRWIEYTHGEYVWYVSPSGESVWELPDGVTAVKSTDV
jgi:hypothetical protein